MRIIVIGAGLSGLAAARLMQEAGHEVVVVDALDRPGGRCKTLRRNGFIIDTCTELATSGYRRWLGLVDSVGFRGDIVKSPMTMGMLRGGRLIELNLDRPLSLPFTPLLSWRGKMRFALGALGMFNTIRSIPVNLLDVAALDDPAVTAEDVALKHFGPEVSRYVLEPMVRMIGGSSMEQVSSLIVPYALSDFSSLITLRGGLDRVPKAVAEKLNVRYQMKVERVRSTADSVVVEYADASGPGSLTADKCLITAQYDDAERIYPRFAEISDHYKERLKFMRLIDIKLAYGTAPKSRAGTLWVPFSENAELNFVSMSHIKSSDRVPAGHSLLSIFTEHAEYERMAAMSDEQLVAWACRQAETLFPELKGHFLFHYLGRQPRTCCFPDPGYFQRTARLWQAIGQESRVHLGGDMFIFGSMEAAVASGERAAERLIA